jgi:AcrR family transcriptional regulator
LETVAHTSIMARPREFDRQAALQIATKLFWQRGFEGVSVSELTGAMNIATPSFYAAFGSKADLYREALECYQHRPGALSTCPLEIDIPVRDAVERVLRMAIATVCELSPSSGCMIANGLLAASPEHDGLAEITANLRGGLIAALEQRLVIAVKRGELAIGTDARTLARYFSAIVQGISVQGLDGAGKVELERLVQFALNGLPIATMAPAPAVGPATQRKSNAVRAEANASKQPASRRTARGRRPRT